MIRTCIFDKSGLHFVVDVEYEEDGNKVVAGGVYAVGAVKEDGKVVMLKCDVDKFYKDYDTELQEALEDEILSLKLAHADLAYEQAREEGRL